MPLLHYVIKVAYRDGIARFKFLSFTRAQVVPGVYAVMSLLARLVMQAQRHIAVILHVRREKEKERKRVITFLTAYLHIGSDKK